MKKILAVLLILALLFSLAACGVQTKETSAANPSSAVVSAAEVTPTPEPTSEPTPEPTAEPTPTPAAKPGDQDILTEKMWLVAGERDFEFFEPIWEDTKRKTFLYNDNGVYKVVDAHGNVIVKTDRWTLFPRWEVVEDGYARFSYREKGAAQEPQDQDSWQLLNDTYWANWEENGQGDSYDVYMLLYDVDGNLIQEVLADSDSLRYLDDNLSPRRYDGMVVQRGETMPVSDDSVVIEPVRDGFLVKTKEGEELGHIVYEARGENECFATSLKNVITIWEADKWEHEGEEITSYMGQRIYWVDVDLKN